MEALGPTAPNRVVCRSRYGYEMHISPQFCTVRSLLELFQLPSLEVMDVETLDLVPPPKTADEPLRMIAGRVYMILTEDDVESVLSDREPPSLQFSPQQAVEFAQTLLEKRKQFIQRHYRHRHPHLLRFSESFLDPSLAAVLRDGSEAALRAFAHPESSRTPIFSLPLFTADFCRDLLEEIDAFEASGLPVMRPNSMNNYGLILDEIGFESFLQDVMLRVVQPFARLLLPDAGSDSLDSHHGFVVQYKLHEDRALDFHYDDSEVTLNVCLGRQFTGGSLYFRGLLADPSTHDEDLSVQHTPGRALLHYGCHRHGARSIDSGERYNLILWCRSTRYRAAQRRETAAEHDHHADHAHQAGHALHHDQDR